MNLRKLILVLVMQLSYTVVLSQSYPSYSRCVGGTSQDQGSALAATADGGWIVAGKTASVNGDITNHFGSYDVWVIKYDRHGEIEWNKCYGGTNIDGSNTIRTTADGGYIIEGVTSSNGHNVSGNHGFSDQWLLKLDAFGAIQWQRCIGGSLNDGIGSVIQTADGGFITCGRTYSTDGDATGNHGDDDILFSRLDASGNVLWTKCFGGSDHEMPGGLHEDSDGNYLFNGGTWSVDGDVNDTAFGPKFWFVKIDTSGNILWQQTYALTSGFGYVYLYPLPGDFYLIYSGSILCVDNSGNIRWQSTTSPGQKYLTGEDGRLFFAATNYSTGVPGSMGNHDYMVGEIDTSTGGLLWQKLYGGSGDDNLFDFCMTTNHELVLTGETYSDDGDVFGRSVGFDMWNVKTTANYVSAEGQMYFDYNLNNLLDSTDKPIRTAQLLTDPDQLAYSVNTNGEYKVFYMDTGNYVLQPGIRPFYFTSPSSHSASLLVSGQVDSLNDFAYQTNSIFDDLCVDISPLGQFRPGRIGSYSIQYENSGTTIQNPHIVLKIFPHTSFSTGMPAPTAVYADSVVWDVTGLLPGDFGVIRANISLDTSWAINDILNSYVQVFPIDNDVNPSCNNSTIEVEISASSDPNDIIVNIDTVYVHELGNPPSLEYVIRFQNTGNDTAFFVRILNQLPARVQKSSVEFISSSHPCEFIFNSKLPRLEFLFNNILLPDSNTNEPASHGFVKYRVKPKSTLSDGDIIGNFASIYFDFNLPVVTNSVFTRILTYTDVEELSVASNVLLVTPNPVLDELVVPSQFEELSYQIYDIQGRVVLSGSSQSKSEFLRLDVSELTSGIYFLQCTAGSSRVTARFVKL